MTRDVLVAANTPARPTLDVQLRRYHRSYRRRLRKFARTSDRLKDLVYAYPAAAFMLAAGAGNPLLRGDATRLVRDGASLKEVGKTLGLPNWTRRLPPEALSEALGSVPGGEAFSRQIVNLIPKNPDVSAMWLQWVLRANAWCDESFALWIARQNFWQENGLNAFAVQPLAAFAWFSQTEGTTARGLIQRPWNAHVGFGKAVDAASAWFVRCLSDYCNDDQGHTGRWFVTQKCSGFRIVPLRTTDALVEEGNRMDHCVGEYASVVATGACLIYSIRRGNDRIATVEVRPLADKSGQPGIIQLRGPGNEDVDDGVSRAVGQWLARQGKYPFAGAGQLARMHFNEARWEKLWRPYQEFRGDYNRAIRPVTLQRSIEQLSRLA